MAYTPTNEDLAYLLDLDKEFPTAADDDLPVAATAGPKIDDVVGVDVPPPAAPIEAEEQPDPDVERAEDKQQVPATPSSAPAVQAPPGIKTQQLASTKGAESKLVSKSPNWYDFLSPPDITGNEGSLLALASGLVAAGFAPNKKAALALALGGVADAAAVKIAAPQQDYRNKLNAAKDQAGMVATLRSGEGGGHALGWANLDLQERKFAKTVEGERQKAEYLKKTKTIGTPESDEIADSLIRGGAYKPEDKKRMSGWQMQQARVAAQQQAGAERSQVGQLKMFNMRQDAKGEWHGIERADKMEDRRLDLDKTLNAEERERTKGLAQAALPGFSYESGYAPEGAAVGAARKTNIARIGATRAAYELAKLQDQVSLIAQGGGKLYTIFGSDENQKNILAKMKALQNRLAANLREIYHQGVPQQFEVALNETVNPRADSIMTFFRGPSAWRELGDEANKAGLEELYNGYGAYENGEVQNPELVKPPMKKGSGQRVQEAGSALDKPSEVVGPAIETGKKAVGAATRAAGQVADAVTGKGDNAPDTIIGEFWVTMPSGKKIQRKMTQKEYDVADGLGYPMEPVQ